MTLACNDSRRWLRQGPPLAPLMFNMYIDFARDRRWPKAMPNVTRIGFADDILLLCESAANADQRRRPGGQHQAF